MSSYDIAASMDEAGFNLLIAELFGQEKTASNLFSGSETLTVLGVEVTVEWEVQQPPTVNLTSPSTDVWNSLISPDGTTPQPSQDAFMVNLPALRVVRRKASGESHVVTMPLTAICAMTINDDGISIIPVGATADLSQSSDFDKAIYKAVIIPGILKVVSFMFSGEESPNVKAPPDLFGPATLAAEAERPRPDLPPHLVLLSEGQWALWRTVGLRGTGFPAAEVLKLSAPECARLADEILAVEDNVQRTRQEAIDAVNAGLDSLRRDQQWDDKGKRRLLLDAVQQLKKGKVPQPLTIAGSADKALENLRDALARRDSLLALLQQTYDAAVANTSCVIRELLGEGRFREAVIWQNRNAWNKGMLALLQNLPDARSRGSKRRQQEELVASYLQRYCVKNDTIGFFGPVGWARVVSEGPAITVKPGSSLLASRRVYFEPWGIDALAKVAASNKSLKPWLAPRPMPFNHLHETALLLPGGGSLDLSTKQAAVLRSCDGQTTAKQIAADLLQVSYLHFEDQQEVYSILESLNKMGIVAWTLDVPLRKDPNQIYRKLIERIGDESLRKPALEALDELEAARDVVADAAGQPEKLNRALDQLEEKFMRLTGLPATRAAGRTYASRTLIYEDCRRDIEVTIGPELWRCLKQPLSLLLTSARWITFEIASLYRKELQKIYAELVKKSGSKTVSAVDFWMKADPLFYKKDTRLVDRIVPAFQRRWSEVLGLPEDKHCVTYTSEELRPRIEAAFAAPRPGWSQARYHSPDVIIAASDPESIERGEYELILGEMHLGTNCLNGVLFLAQHPRPEEIYEAIEADFPEPRISPVPPKQWGDLTLRTSFEFTPPKDYRLEIAPETCGTDSGQPLSIGSLVVEDTDRGLMLKSRDGRIQFEIIEALGEFLSNLVMNFFSLLSPAEHTPRISVDRLVICRETWRFAPQEIGFAYEEDEASRFLAARHWMRKFGLPRFVFIKSPVERKPFYVDMDSPVYVNIFAKLIRRTSESAFSNQTVTVVEMLPTHDQAWLIDAKGNHHTSEFRMVMVDLTR